MKFTKAVLISLFMLGTSGIVTDAAFARRGGGFSSSRSYSSRRSVSSRSSTWRKTRSSTAVYRSRKRKPIQSAADRRANSKTAKYSSKAEATKAFVNRYKGTYTQKPTPGKPAPAKRPDYIPSSTSLAGKTYNVTYNVDRGGYGYWNGGGPGLGTWMMYDALSDVAMMSLLMNRHNIHYGAAAGTRPPYSHSAFSSAMPIIGLLIIGIIIVWGYRCYA